MNDQQKHLLARLDAVAKGMKLLPPPEPVKVKRAYEIIQEWEKREAGYLEERRKALRRAIAAAADQVHFADIRAARAAVIELEKGKF